MYLRVIINPKFSMMTKSIMTMERGTSENLFRNCSEIIERYKGVKCNERIWYKKRDASWSCQVYSADIKSPICDMGQGWDIFSSVENFRLNLLRYFDEELKPASSFVNLYEITLILDRRDDVIRNKVGAVVESNKTIDDDVTKKFLSHPEVNELAEGLSSLLKKFEALCDKQGVEV